MEIDKRRFFVACLPVIMSKYDIVGGGGRGGGSLIRKPPPGHVDTRRPREVAAVVGAPRRSPRPIPRPAAMPCGPAGDRVPYAKSGRHVWWGGGGKERENRWDPHQKVFYPNIGI